MSENEQEILSLPTIYAKCPKCTAHYAGKHVGDYYATHYPRRKAGLTGEQVVSTKQCENCKGPMTFVSEIV